MSKDSVTIKSFPNGLNVILSPEVSFDILLEEIQNKFTESARFFGSAKRAISFEGRKLTNEQENLILEVIEKACQLKITCIIENDEDRNQIYLKAMEQFTRASEAAKGNIYKGCVKGGQVIETPYTIVILGDVNAGATVKSGGSVVVLGTIYGTVICGAGVTAEAEMDVSNYRDDIKGYGECFIAALDMRHPSLFVGELEATDTEKALKAPLLGKSPARIVYESEGKVVIEAITKDFLNAL